MGLSGRLGCTAIVAACTKIHGILSSSSELNATLVAAPEKGGNLQCACCSSFSVRMIPVARTVLLPNHKVRFQL